MSVKKTWVFRIEHILDAIAKIQQYTAGMTEEAFCASGITVDAVIRNFLIIGEATRHVPADIRAKHPEIPWTLMQGMRDEFTFSNGTPPDIRADIVFFVNGVPVLIVETKRATALDGIAQALDDIRYYHRKGPEFLALVQLHALTHLVQFYYGATVQPGTPP